MTITDRRKCGVTHGTLFQKQTLEKDNNHFFSMFVSFRSEPKIIYDAFVLGIGLIFTHE